ncbi:hypothetical protein CFIMG_000816RA [Ceratocystis fimbriata CBS 114723]|uniref:C2H2-type domain-containing protein n=1 Tax=Ceratocystis fimbriata CBS 114723 TaxID=1035309 RepID=A0A2C5X4Y2_9PEZI|nr:hypothetical protein CFIMG_000816RA [Ceratocystis fimbriata CBS 114723]
MFTVSCGWGDGSGSGPGDASLSHMDPEDAQVFMGLVQKYGPVNLMFPLRQMSDHDHGRLAARMSTATMSSHTPSVFSSAQSIASDAASIYTVATQSTWDSGVETTPFSNDTFHDGVPWTPPTSHPGPDSPDSANPNSATAPSSLMVSTGGVRKNIECTLCFMDGVNVGFTRKSDFKKHLQHFHCTNAIWACPYSNCTSTFDFEKAFVNHAKSAHGDVHLPSNKARQETCPQLVFACGFKSCKDRVFEAANEEAAAQLKEKYFDHVAKHFDAGVVTAEWQYSVVMHNLLRQNALKYKWKSCVWNKSHRNQLRWRPETSAHLKRLLECRHIYDSTANKASTFTLLHFLFNLGERYMSGYNQPPMPMFPANFTPPLRSLCPMTATGHASLPAPTEPEPMYDYSVTPRPVIAMSTHSHSQSQSQPHQRQEQQQQQPPMLIPPRPPSSHPMQPAPQTPIHIKTEPPNEIWPHPGTPMAIPEASEWPEQGVPMFGPPTAADEMMYTNPTSSPSPIMDVMMGNAMPNEAIAPWVNIENMGRMGMDFHMASSRNAVSGGASTTGSSASAGTASSSSSSSTTSKSTGSSTNSRPKTPKRSISRSFDTMRFKRRGTASTAGSTDGHSTPRLMHWNHNHHQRQHGMALPMRTTCQNQGQGQLQTHGLPNGLSNGHLPGNMPLPPTSQPTFFPGPGSTV